MTVDIRRATQSDADAIHSIITISSRISGILPRSFQDIVESIDTFVVAEVNGDMAGVVSFYNYGPELKEVRSLSVKKEYSRQGIGSLLLNNLVKMINENSRSRIFALSSLPEFFINNGFRTVDRSTLPEKIWKDCDVCAKKERCTSTALEYAG